MQLQCLCSIRSSNDRLLELYIGLTKSSILIFKNWHKYHGNRAVTCNGETNEEFKFSNIQIFLDASSRAISKKEHCDFSQKISLK